MSKTVTLEISDSSKVEIQFNYHTASKHWACHVRYLEIGSSFGESSVLDEQIFMNTDLVAAVTCWILRCILEARCEGRTDFIRLSALRGASTCVDNFVGCALDFAKDQHKAGRMRFEETYPERNFS